MTKPVLFTLTQTPDAPVFRSLYEDLGYEVMPFTTVRKSVNALKKYQPDIVIAQFIYAYSTNYASNHISNLDTLLITLQTLAGKKPHIIYLCNKQELVHLDELIEQYNGCCETSHAITIPYNKDDMQTIIESIII